MVEDGVITGDVPTDTVLDMPLQAYVGVAEDAGFETVLSAPFMRAKRLQIRGLSEDLGEVQEQLVVLARRDGFLLVVETYTASGLEPVVNMAELNYRFQQGSHHETVAEFDTLKIRLTDALADDERIYHAVVSGLGGTAPMDDGTMCVSAIEDVRTGLRMTMDRKGAYMRLPSDRLAKVGVFLSEWPDGFLHTYGFTLARPCETALAQLAEPPRRMAESRRITNERLRLLPAWARIMIGCGDDADRRAA